MNNPTIAGADHAIPAVRAENRVILPRGGKGGVGKTSVIVGLAEWFGVNHIPISSLTYWAYRSSDGKPLLRSQIVGLPAWTGSL